MNDKLDKKTDPDKNEQNISSGETNKEPAADTNLEKSAKTRPDRRTIPVFDNPKSKSRDTAVLSDRSQRLRRKLKMQSSQGTASLGAQREIIFVIRGMVERFVLTDNLSIILGRADPGAHTGSDMINLTHYGALDRGVSREHARLHLKDNRLYVTDLGSTNGTFLAGKRLLPNEPTLLRKGDELLLGRLAVQVLFR